MKIKYELTIEDFKEMEKLEKQYYDESYITPAEESYACYIHRKGSILVVEDKGKIVGFMNLFPIRQELYEQIRKGVFNDKDLTYRDIVDIEKENVESVNLFLSCVVIDRIYRRTGALSLLLKSYCHYYQNWNVKEIIIDNVTQDGERFSEKWGFKYVVESNHKSKIYYIDFQDFVQRISSS